MAERRIEQRFSATAGYTSFSRACAHCAKDARFRGPDDVAEVFLPLFAKGILRVPALRRFFFRRIAPPGIYEYVLARTKLLDALFVGALDDGVPQIVLLGAGMDTRAIRFRDRNHGTKVFELDIGTTQRPKLEILARKGIPLPAELVFVAIDFDRESLAEALTAAGYRSDRRSLFLWEGVTMYLTAEAVDATLAFVRAAAEARIAFDYVYASVLRGEGGRYGEREIRRRVSKAGEGWTFGIEDGGADAYLADRGLRLVEHHAPADLEKEYLTADDGRIFGRINGAHAIAVAEARVGGG